MGELAGTVACEDMLLGFHCPAGGCRAEVSVGGSVVEALLEGGEPTVHELEEPGVVLLAVVLEG